MLDEILVVLGGALAAGAGYLLYRIGARWDRRDDGLRLYGAPFFTTGGGILILVAALAVIGGSFGFVSVISGGDGLDWSGDGDPTTTSTTTSTSTTTKEPRCEPGYKDVCLDPKASDYDCGGLSNDGPKYVWEVIGVGKYDRFDLDRDGDGFGCENFAKGGSIDPNDLGEPPPDY